MMPFSTRWLFIGLFVLGLGVGGCSDDAGGTKAPSGGNNGTDVGQSDVNEDLDVSRPTDTGDSDTTDAASDVCVGEDCQVVLPPLCNPLLDADCPCRAGQMRLCSSYGDPLEFPTTSPCRAGVQRCLNGDWEETCHGEYAPEDGECGEPDVPMSCDGVINERGQCVEGPSGEPVDDNVLCPEGGSGGIGDPCSCEIPENGDPELLRRNQPCYTGDINTLGRGICQAGVRNCQADGTWGACVGEVTPQAEVCGDGLDNNCNGIIDDGCPNCPEGVESCDGVIGGGGLVDPPCPGGQYRNACGGCEEVLEIDICGDGLDNNCSGTPDEGCPCSDVSQPCYAGPAEHAGIGACQLGIQFCLGEFWGPCEGSVLPTIELCGDDGNGNGQDNNCNGVIDDGCGCTDGQTRACGSSTGACEQGTQTCNGSLWGPCEGAIGPSPEVCDGVDNNCNGIVDENLRNACGTCGDSCYLQPANPAISGLLDEGAEVVEADDPDNPQDRPGLSLAKQTFFPPYLWAANTDSHTVSKFNTETNQEEGRYWVGLSPSRTAVDLEGNMWVVGRNDGRVTKVLWDVTSCPPGDGTTINTSQYTPSGATQLNSQANPLADDCVVYSQNPTAGKNQTHNSGRGLAVDPTGRIWIGYSDGPGGLQSIHPQTFETSEVYPTTGMPVFAPDANGVQQPQFDANGDPILETSGQIYGLVGDSQHHIYVSALWDGRGLPRFNTQTNSWDAYYTGFNCAIYGIAIDGQNRIWMGCSNPGWGPSHNSIGGGVAVFDPATNKVTRFYVPTEFQTRLPGNGEVATALTSCPTNEDCANRFQVTALAVEPATGNVWATVRSIGYVIRLEIDENDMSQSEWTFIPVLRDANNDILPGLGTAPDMRGIGFDRLGYAWHLGLSSQSVFKIDPATNERVDIIGLGTSGHYTYSDFTGSTAFSFTAPRGYWRYYFEAGFPNAQLDAVRLEAHVPAQTTLGVRVRPLNSNGNPIGPWVPSDANGVAVFFQYPEGEDDALFDLNDYGGSITGYTFEVEVRMTSNDPAVRPILYDLELEWQRP